MPLLDEHQIVSVDDHLVEHPRVWQDRLPASYVASRCFADSPATTTTRSPATVR